MTSVDADVLDFQPRRVVSGLDENGKSTIILDEKTTARTATKAFTLCDVWRVDAVPGKVDAPDILEPGHAMLEPSPDGLLVRVSTVPPDSTWDPKTEYAEALGAIGYDAKCADPEDTPGWHVTDTTDIVTVLSGEFTAILETTETVLKPGDTFVQRGTNHAWANRGDVPVIAVTTMVGARR